MFILELTSYVHWKDFVVVFGILDNRGMSVLFASVPKNNVIMYVNEGLQVVDNETAHVEDKPCGSLEFTSVFCYCGIRTLSFLNNRISDPLGVRAVWSDTESKCFRFNGTIVNQHLKLAFQFLQHNGFTEKKKRRPLS